MIGFDVLALFFSTKKIGRLAVVKSDDGSESSDNRIPILYHVTCLLQRELPPIQKDVQSTIWERLEIEDKYKGLVLGKGRSKLREISAKTGAKVICKGARGDVYIILGNEEQRTRAKVQIGNVVVGTYLFFSLGEIIVKSLNEKLNL